MKALRGPFPQLKVVPTGGVDKGNIKDWFNAGALAVGLGTNLAPKAAIAAEDFETLKKNAEDVMASCTLDI
jgi:2-dehydro-3-deoxyphosphogluconate aldolase/(4S)-4-hydroxy-2-oxoglutarate aldolase